MLRISSKGYFVQKISLSEKRFSKQMVHITEVQKDVAARSCQLLKINDLTQEIFLTNWTRKSTFLTVLACRTPTKTCQIESYANMSESLYKEYSDERTCQLNASYFTSQEYLYSSFQTLCNISKCFINMHN